MIFSFHPEAEDELNLSVDYYENCSKGLGAEFAVEIYSTIQRIIENHRACVVLGDDVRRSLTKRFPYGVLYTIDSNQIFILAVMNLHRDPDYWKNRFIEKAEQNNKRRP